LDLTSPYVAIILFFAVALLALGGRRRSRSETEHTHPAAQHTLLDEGSEQGFGLSRERLP
jgi:hypothetical protein